MFPWTNLFLAVVRLQNKVILNTTKHKTEGPEGVKWELGFAYFWVGKWDFMHWDWDSSAKKQ
jgi:hypothetical protein